MTDDLLFRRAVDLAALLRSRELSAVELMEATLARIAAVNPAVNAVVTLLPERAIAGARAADAALARGDQVGPLHGLPIAHKDTMATAGVRTTWGSPIFAEFVPETDALIVEREKAAGAITIGKTNVPEFGAGSHTFNPVFGATRNPYDRGVSSGGSSGGAAVALACGMHPIADGSDLGGSLRNPAGWNNVVGFRPSPGRVPSWPTSAAWFPLTVQGPLARTVEDVALMLSAVAGPDRRAPLSLAEDPAIFAHPLGRDLAGLRVAWSPTLGGLPVDRRVAAVVAAQRAVFEGLGCNVEEAEPDLTDADEVFETLRAWDFELGLGQHLDEHPDLLKQTVVWNIEQGRALSGPDVGRAERLRTLLYERVRSFFERCDALVLPVSQVPPFPIEEEYPTAIEGVPMESYIAWMRSCSRITATGCPAISVPAGFTPEGYPTGLQIVGPPRADRLVLEVAYAFQEATGYWKRRPVLTE